VPIYDYRCDACGHAFSAVQAMTEAPLERCPQCGSRPRRVPSRPAIVFKGSGWHITDYRRDKGGSSAAEDTGTKPADKRETGKKSPAEGSEPAGEGKTEKSREKPAKSDDAAAAN
jgi:putative FmdB family regulatory protein